MTLTRLRTRAYAAGLAAVLALAGCGDPDGGNGPAATGAGTAPVASTTTMPTAASAATSAGVDPVLARIPAAARPETREGAEAFAKFFFEQVNLAFTKPSAEVLPGLYEQTCSVCVSLQNAALDLETKRERHSGTSIEVTGASVRDFTPANRTVVLFVSQNSVSVRNSAGMVVRQTNKEEGAFLATLTRREGRWVVTKLQVGK